MRRLYGPLAVLVVLAGLFFALPSIYNNQALLFNMMVYLALAQGSICYTALRDIYLSVM